MNKTLPERDKIIEEHLDFAKDLARRRHRSVSSVVQYDELLSAAYAGLIDAAERYDPAKVHKEAKKPFLPYARRRISGEMNDYLRSCNWGTRNHPRQARSLDMTLDYVGSPLKDILSTKGRKTIDMLNSRELFNKIIRSLPPKVKRVFILRYINGLTMKQVADDVGISESRVSQLISQYVEYLEKVWRNRKHDLWSEV